MKHLMMTTAIVAATSFGAFAQTAPATTTDTTAPAMTATAGQAQAVNVPAFRASNFTGMTLYTLDSDAARNVRTHQDQARWNSGDAFTAERDRWESVGSIADIVMTQDGAVRGILIDVGGFLGFFARTVMIDIEELYFVADDSTPEDISDFFVVASMTREQLENLPEWSDDTLATGYAPRNYSMDRTGQTRTGYGSDAAMTTTGTTTGTVASDVPPAATVNPDPSVASMEGRAGAPGAPAPAPEGYVVVDGALPSADQLIGANVYDAMGESVGNVNDLTLNGQAEVAEVLVDVGGFLGIGSHTVALPVDNVDVLWNASTDSVRIHLPMTRDMIESLPEHQG